MFSFFLSQK